MISTRNFRKLYRSAYDIFSGFERRKYYKNGKMMGKVLINQLTASKRRLVVVLVLAVIVVDLCFFYSSYSHDETALKSSRPARRAGYIDGNVQRINEVDFDPRWNDIILERTAENPRWSEEAAEMARMGTGGSVEQDQQVLTGFGEVSLQRLEVESSENNVNIRLNGSVLLSGDWWSGRQRGLHVLVVDQRSGRVMARRRFDTVLSQVYQEAISFLHAVRPGRIIVFASKDDISYNLHSDLRYKLAELGSQFIPQINFRDQWAMVTVKGNGEALGEAHSPSPVGEEHGGPLFLRVDLPIGALPATEECHWPPSEETSLRRRFCTRYEGYPGLCRCLQPHSIMAQPSHTEVEMSSVFTVVMATHRPQYLYRCLRSLSHATGSRPDQIVVYLQNHDNPETEALVQLFGFQTRYVATEPSSRVSTAIGNRIMAILDDVFTAFSHAEYLIFLEEDLQCSPDFFNYFAHTHRLLEEDPSLFSVSAFNIHSHVNTSLAVDTAYRVDSFTALAFLMARNTYLQEVKTVWPKFAERADWDIFLNRAVKKDRECIVPDVNRVYHLGRDSVYINTDLFDKFYQNLSSNPDPQSTIQRISRLHKLNYESDLMETIRQGSVIEDYKEMCAASNMTGNFKSNNRTEVIFFHMNDKDDISTWTTISQCWGLWSLDTTGSHAGLWRFWIENKKGFFFHIIMIGTPYSKYSSFMPASLIPYRVQLQPVRTKDSTSSPSSSSSPRSSSSSSGVIVEPARVSQSPSPPAPNRSDGRPVGRSSAVNPPTSSTSSSSSARASDAATPQAASSTATSKPASVQSQNNSAQPNHRQSSRPRGPTPRRSQQADSSQQAALRGSSKLA